MKKFLHIFISSIFLFPTMALSQDYRVNNTEEIDYEAIYEDIKSSLSAIQEEALNPPKQEEDPKIFLEIDETFEEIQSAMQEYINVQVKESGINFEQLAKRGEKVVMEEARKLDMSNLLKNPQVLAAQAKLQKQMAKVQEMGLIYKPKFLRQPIAIMDVMKEQGITDKKSLIQFIEDNKEDFVKTLKANIEGAKNSRDKYRDPSSKLRRP